MNSRYPWKHLLETPKGYHIAQIYQEQEFLSEAVTLFIGAGLRVNESVMVIATRAHLEDFARQLENEGFNVTDAVKSTQLKFLDAEEVLSKFQVNQTLDTDRIREFFTDIVNQAKARDVGIRIYGEIVDLLWLQGNMETARIVEQCWNELLQQEAFSLFCCYQMNNLNKDVYHGPLQRVCAAHSHLIPVRDYVKFSDTVERAALEIMGDSLSRDIRKIAANDSRSATMPLGQTTLLFLHENIPHTADEILSRIRLNFR